MIATGIVLVGMHVQSGYRAVSLLDTRSPKAAYFALSVHLVLFSALAYWARILFAQGTSVSTGATILWLGLASLAYIFWGWIVSSWRGWWKFALAERKLIAISLLAGFAIYLAGEFSSRYWEMLSDFTIQVSAILLSGVYDTIILDASEKILGAGDFWVYIDRACSGIEGMVVALSISGIYLFLSKSSLRFPRAFVLLPIACILSLLFNVLRISLLVMLGAEGWPDIAVKGFHSVAGWVGSVLVALLIVFVFSTWRWISAEDSNELSVASGNDDPVPALAVLFPFTLSLFLLLLTRLVTVDFNYFHPVIVLGTGVSLFVFWRKYGMRSPDVPLAAVGCGVVIAVSWALLDPDGAQNWQKDLGVLGSLPLWFAAGWTTIRLIGFTVVTPIVEELFFRGYLMARLSREPVDLNRRIAGNWLSFLVPSILFGLLHQSVIAGAVAGALFGLLRIRTDRISNCIVAHATANGLLATGWLLPMLA